MKYFRQHQAGDTIVEVLVAIVIVATVLGGAYATANRSLLATRESEERGEALNLAQGQIEALRGLALSATLQNITQPTSIFDQQDIFCLTTIGTTPTPKPAINNSSGNPLTLGSMSSLSQDSDAAYTSDCKQDPENNGYTYDVAIDVCYPPNSTGECAPYYTAYNTSPNTGEPANSALFIVHVRWDSISGGLNDASLQYRLYEPHT